MYLQISTMTFLIIFLAKALKIVIIDIIHEQGRRNSIFIGEAKKLTVFGSSKILTYVFSEYK